MVFKRRDRRPIWQIAAQFLYPRGGWARAFEYVKHRVRRLPDTPEKISRGIMVGVATSFTPFFGLHFVIAIILARLLRGNMLAALMGTFFGNPLTYIPIAWTSLATGHWMMGRRFNAGVFDQEKGECGLGCQFSTAMKDLLHNFQAIFSSERMDWHGLAIFYNETFYPFMIGSIIPGIITGIVAYYVTVPVISAYQSRRRKRLRAKLEQLKK